MKTRRIFALLLALVLVFALAACNKSTTDPATSPSPTAPADTSPSPDETPASAYPLTITDQTGRTVTIDEPVTRAIVLTAADAEIVYALGAGDLVVGRGAYCDWPVEIFDVTAVNSGSETNLEQIIALNPQVVFCGTMDQSLEQIQQLEEAGIKAVVSTATNIAETYESIEIIGKVLDKTAEATAIIDGMKAAFAQIAENKVGEGKTVYFEVSALPYLWTSGKGSFVDEIADMLGLTNIFNDTTGAWVEISEEQVLDRNPDYIISLDIYSYADGPVEEILSRAAWQNVTAVKNGAIILVGNNELIRPAPRLAEGARILADFVATH
ncbi:MAG: ABC transporter substrate-binding protein [Oscillospiraceae bacterium]|jgi:iron complex transport system substrate-binding protein|nr:ABC transporter substrate-binding protein [Oscillospiraceae bacterium]